MIEPTHWGMVGVKSINVVLGGLITYYAYRAYRRSRSTPIGAVAVGFALITVGGVIGGAIDLLSAMPTTDAIVAQDVFVAAGFLAILYSLFV